MVSPYRGTKLYELSGASELFPEACTKAHDLTMLQATVNRAFREFYLRPAVLWSRLRRMDPRLWRRQVALFRAFVRPALS